MKRFGLDLLLLASLTFLIWTNHLIAGRISDTTGIPVLMITSEAHNNVTLPCPGVTERSLITTLQWASHTKLVEYMSETTTVWEHRHRINLLSDNFALHFHPVIAEDSGEYSCLVNNRPKPEAIVKLVVQDVPDPPGRPLIMGFTSRSANLSWAPPQNTHNSPVKFYSIHVRVGEDGHWDVKNAIITSNNETSYQVLGLYPFTVYSFRVVATNSMGPSQPSKESYYMVTLREVPDGKPTVTMAYNTSSTSIHISWRAPHKNTIHGEFLGYRISYRPREKGDDEVKEIYIRDSNVDSHTIQNLETYTQYLVSVQVFNPEGPGPNATVLVMTDEGEPSKPLNLTVIRATSTTVELSWAKPEHENGDIKGYRIYFMHGNYTDVRTTSTPVLSHTLDTLRPYTEYKIWVKAYTWKNEGLQSDSVRYRTDVGGPSAPTITNLTCQSNNTLYVEWRRPRPADYYITIDQYFLLYRSFDSNEFEEKSIGASESLDNTTGLYQTLLTNLTTDSLYEVQVQAGTKSIYYEKELIRGSLSGTRTIFVKTDCDKYSPLLSQVPSELSAGMIAGFICVIVAILIALSVLIMWKKCFKASYYYLDDPTAMSVPTACDWDQQKENGVNTAIPIHLFAKHVASLHADGDIGFSKEYETIQNSCTEGHTVINSQLPDNKNKNRYLNILAYDHTRVHLLPLPGQKKSTEYLNANYIDGFQRSRAYIGTQGPLPATFNCFWRMVWEQRVRIIVMITNLIERGRRKCDMYWPKEGTEVYGVISVTMVKEDIRATYTIRTFTIRHLRIKKKKTNVQERTVLQYHYTNWPDHGTPDHPLPILRFVSKSSAANPPDAGPIIVHCSAGVGRTGAYIVLDAMLKQIKAKGEVNIYGFLRHIRTQRNFLVQTEEQYVFIHDALVEAIESGETNIHQGYLSRYLSTMVANPQCDKSLPGIVLDNQYKLVTSFRAEDYNTISARKPVNVSKNRNNEIVPMECFRVHLTPKPGVDGSDYINATWLIGYHKMREFIITQTPVEETLMDFWQMVWDHSAQTVVLLTNTESQELNPFWPTEQNLLEGENYKVKLVVESEQNGCTMRDFTLQSAQDDYDLPVRIFHYPSWPHSCSPLHKVFDLIKKVQEWNKETQHGPVIVVDRYGGTEAATFCLLTSVFKQLTHESHVDIYMYAKLYHLRRLGIWPAVNDYLYLYEAIEALANSSGFTSAGAVTPTPVGLGPTPDIYISSNGHINGYIRFDSDNINEVTPVHNENGFPCTDGDFEGADGIRRSFQGNGTVPNINNISIEENSSSAQ